MPLRFTGLGQDPHVQTGRIDQPNPLAFGKGCQDIVHIGNHEVIAAVSKNGVNRHSFRDPDQCLERVAGNADEPGFPLLLYLTHRGDGLVDDLLYISKLNIVRLEQVHIVGLKPPQRLVNAAGNSLSREVEVLQAVAAALGAEHHFVALSDQCLS